MKYPRDVEGFLVDHTGPKGYGFFATRTYKKGELLCKVTGTKMNDSNPKLSHRAIQIAKGNAKQSIGKTSNKDVFIEPYRFSIIWYLNHSCDPNAYFDHDVLYARRVIEVGEEITADYSLFTNYHSWDMDCLCHHEKCRKTILPYQRLHSKHKKSKEFVSGYLLK